MADEEKPVPPRPAPPHSPRTPSDERLERARERIGEILDSPLYRRIRDRDAVPDDDSDVDPEQLMRDIADLAALISRLETAYDEVVHLYDEVLRERRAREGGGTGREP